MNCPHCGTALTPKKRRFLDFARDVYRCLICGKQCTAEQAVQFSKDPNDPPDKEPWQR